MKKIITITKETMAMYGAPKAAVIVLDDNDPFNRNRTVVRRKATGEFIVAIRGDMNTVMQHDKETIIAHVACAMNRDLVLK